jgi:hypothetical protein
MATKHRFPVSTTKILRNKNALPKNALLLRRVAASSLFSPRSFVRRCGLTLSDTCHSSPFFQQFPVASWSNNDANEACISRVIYDNQHGCRGCTGFIHSRPLIVHRKYTDGIEQCKVTRVEIVVNFRQTADTFLRRRLLIDSCTHSKNT